MRFWLQGMLDETPRSNCLDEQSLWDQAKAVMRLYVPFFLACSKHCAGQVNRLLHLSHRVIHCLQRPIHIGQCMRRGKTMMGRDMGKVDAPLQAAQMKSSHHL